MDEFGDRMCMPRSDSTVDMIHMDYRRNFSKVDHGILLHKLKDLEITSKFVIWVSQFLTNGTNYAITPGNLIQTAQF